MQSQLCSQDILLTYIMTMPLCSEKHFCIDVKSEIKFKHAAHGMVRILLDMYPSNFMLTPNSRGVDGWGGIGNHKMTERSPNILAEIYNFLTKYGYFYASLDWSVSYQGCSNSNDINVIMMSPWLSTRLW